MVRVVKVSSKEYEDMVKTALARPGGDAAQQEYIEGAKAIVAKHNAAVDSLNQEWRDSFKTRKPLAYHEQSEIETRKYEAALTDLKRSLFTKHNLGDVPVSEYEYKLWSRNEDERTPKLDKLRIGRNFAYDKFEKSLTADIEASPGRKLRYNKEGELGEFSQKTQALYRALKTIDKKIAGLEQGWPAEPQDKETIRLKSWLVGVQQQVRLPHREKDDTIERTFTVRAKTAKLAEKAIRDTGIRGRVMAATPEKTPYILAEMLSDARSRPTGNEPRKNRREVRVDKLEPDTITIDPDDPNIEVWKPAKKPKKAGRLVLLVKRRENPETSLGGMKK